MCYNFIIPNDAKVQLNYPSEFSYFDSPLLENRTQVLTITMIPTIHKAVHLLKIFIFIFF